MKLNTVVIIFKGLSYFLVGFFTPWTTALAQWIGEGAWPPRIIWIGVILPASVIGGFSALQAFFSGSFTEFKDQKKADDSQEVQTIVVKPTPPTVPVETRKANTPLAEPDKQP